MHLTEELEGHFKMVMTKLHTRLGTRDLVLDFANCQETDTFRTMFDTYNSVEYATKLGFELRNRGKLDAENDRIVGRCMFLYAVHAVGECACISYMFQVPPASILLLSEGSPDESALRRALHSLSSWWSCLQKLEEDAISNKVAVDFLDDMLWPRQQWCR